MSAKPKKKNQFPKTCINIGYLNIRVNLVKCIEWWETRDKCENKIGQKGWNKLKLGQLYNEI